jgi:phage terminase large subunit GpA-like protein
MREFAEQEIVLPSGPYQGERFRLDRLPWFKLWLGAVDSHQWRRYGLTGVGQGGKTLGGSALPVMYHLFEHRETVVYGAPSLEMCNDKWRQDILPLIEASQYRDLLPESGRGSKGGTALSVQFTNGATLKFMSGGGSDKARAGFTTRVAVITESDGFDEAGEKSREADPFSQIEARTSAFGDRAVVYQECTVSTEEGRTWKELKAGTDSRIILACPHCQRWATPEREHFTGWQEATSVMEARERGGLHCPLCGTIWSEADRKLANDSARLLHRGQDLDPDGKIVGAIAPSLTFFLRFTAANNLLVPMARVAEEEFNAPRTTDAALAERKLRQFWWTLPSESESLTLSEIDASAIAGRVVDIPRGRVPADATKITIGIDCGKWLHHWVAIAWRHGAPHVIEYGRLEVPSQSMAEEIAILTALRRFRDEVVNIGWPSVVEGVPVMRPETVLVDAGNWESTIVAFCKESSTGIPYWPCKGFGIQQIGRRVRMHDPGYERSPQPGGYDLLDINADFWKSYVHARLQTPIAQPGGLSLFHGTVIEHLSFAKHLTAEKRVEEFIGGKGLVSRWEKINRNNHFLDALALGCVGGHGVGERIVAAVETQVAAQPRSASHSSVPDWVGGGR